VLLQVLVCGSPEVDVNLLEACTEYNACSRHDSHVGYFWDVLRCTHGRVPALLEPSLRGW
jgi:hypothetical protein